MGIQCLFRLVDTPDPLTVLHSVYAMGNIACSRRWAKELMRHGALEAILEVFSSDRCDRAGQRACAYALANLAAKPHSHAIFKEYLAKLISLLDVEDVEVARYISLTVLNLSANPVMIPPLIANRVTSVLLNILVDEQYTQQTLVPPPATTGPAPTAAAAALAAAAPSAAPLQPSAQALAMADTRLNVVSTVLNLVANHQLKLMIVAEGFVRELVGCAVRSSGLPVPAPASASASAQTKVYSDEPKVVSAVCAVMNLLSTLNETHRALAQPNVLQVRLHLSQAACAFHAFSHLSPFAFV
jgi:hypothetical protein